MRRQNEAVSSRHNRIINLLANHEFLTVRDLSTMLAISEVTIRRDLETLDLEGKINRRHGGAFRSTERSGESHREGSEDAAAEGQIIRTKAIAACALGLLETGNVVLLSAGPISEEISRGMLSIKDLTVVTNSVAIFDILRANADIHLIATGGELRRTQNTLIGPLAEASVREIRVDKLFLEPSGISRGYQLFHSSIPDVSMQQAMIQAAREIIVVAEHSVFGREGIMQIGSIQIAGKLIADAAIPVEIRNDIESKGVQIVTAQG